MMLFSMSRLIHRLEKKLWGFPQLITLRCAVSILFTSVKIVTQEITLFYLLYEPIKLVTFIHNLADIFITFLLTQLKLSSTLVLGVIQFLDQILTSSGKFPLPPLCCPLQYFRIDLKLNFLEVVEVWPRKLQIKFRGLDHSSNPSSLKKKTVGLAS